MNRKFTVNSVVTRPTNPSTFESVPLIGASADVGGTGSGKLPKWLNEEFSFIPYVSVETLRSWRLTSWLPSKKKSFLWRLNAAGFVFHFILAMITLGVSASGKGGLNTPVLDVYLTRLTWNMEESRLEPSIQATDPISLTLITVTFFIMSAIAHLLVIVLNYNQAFDAPDAPPADASGIFGWYYVNLGRAASPGRWVEYAFSSSIMLITLAVAAGITQIYQLALTFSLMFCVICFGYYAERLSPPDPSNPKQWLINKNTPENIWLIIPGRPRLSAKIERLTPHFIGYLPYACIWVILLHSFVWNANNGEGGRGPPAFVYAIIFSQVALFSSFGITQFVVLYRDDGPTVYFRAEISYLVLSVVSKGVLGLILISQVFLYQSFAEAVEANQ